MDAEAAVIFDTPRRVAVPAHRLWLAATISSSAVGVYFLPFNGYSICVDPSNERVLTGLLGHPCFLDATHMSWEPLATAEQALRHEAAWFHILERTSLRNLIHPACPAGSIKSCPFCDTGDEDALLHALEHLHTCVETASPTL